MPYFAQIESGKVAAIMQTSEPLTGSDFVEITSYDTSLLGATWDGSDFIPADPEPSYLIAVGSFFDRFGMYAIPILASTDVSVQALVKFITPRKLIDLTRADLPGALDLIIAAGFPINKSAILNTPCQPGEEP